MAEGDDVDDAIDDSDAGDSDGAEAGASEDKDETEEGGGEAPAPKKRKAPTQAEAEAASSEVFLPGDALPEGTSLVCDPSVYVFRSEVGLVGWVR